MTIKIKAAVIEAEEGGYFAQVPALPGCATQGETMDELMANLREAIEGSLSIDIATFGAVGADVKVLEVAFEAVIGG